MATAALMEERKERQHDSKKSRKNKKAYDTRYSQAVTHPSTNRARRCLTSVIGRELVCSTWYGRKRISEDSISLLCISLSLTVLMLFLLALSHRLLPL